MTAVALGICWAGYTLSMWGYCLVKGYDVPFSGLFHATWPGGGQQSSGTAVPPADPGIGTYNV